MIEMHKNVIRYYREHGLRYAKKSRQRDFFANGADSLIAKKLN